MYQDKETATHQGFIQEGGLGGGGGSERSRCALSSCLKYGSQEAASTGARQAGPQTKRSQGRQNALDQLRLGAGGQGPLELPVAGQTGTETSQILRLHQGERLRDSCHKMILVKKIQGYTAQI